MSSISRYYDVVFEILRKHPTTRDSDAVLYYRVLESAGHDPKVMTVAEFLKLLHTNAVPNWETISRIRRKIQEEFESTRGQRYKARHDQEIQVVTDLMVQGQNATEKIAKTMNMLQQQLSLEPIP